MTSPTDEAPPPELTLTDLPSLLLTRLLSSPGVSIEDLARVSCVNRSLRDVASAPSLPQWAAVRVAGSTSWWWPDADTFKARRRIAMPSFLARGRLAKLAHREIAVVGRG